MIPHVLTDNTLTFYDEEFKPTQILVDHPEFAAVVKAINADDLDKAKDLARPVTRIAAVVNAAVSSLDASYFRRKAGKIEVTDWGVTLDGKALHGVVIDRLLEVLRHGLDVAPWVNFVQKLHQNPSSVSRDELYLWLEKAEMPITADGDFLAYKNVRADYRDIHSGTFDNKVGSVCEMSRLDVDDDRNQTCSAGLHFCSKAYLPNFSHAGSGGHTMVVKINPADVVSIPSDYNDTKGRTWRYEVVGEIEDPQAKVWGPVTNDYDSDDYSDYYDDETFEGYEDGAPLFYDEDTPADRTLIGQVFAAYANRFGAHDTKSGAEREVRLLRSAYVLGYDEIKSFNDLMIADAKALIEAWS